MIPPNQHPLDFLAIPEIRGEKISFIVRTKTGWICTLCSSDKFVSVDEHVRERNHAEIYNKLQIRKNELLNLVEQTEQKLIEEQKQQQLQEKHRKAEAKKAMENSISSRDQFSKKIVATERRANLKESHAFPAAEKGFLRRERNFEVEDLSSRRSEEATRDIRQIRAQRLSSQKSQPSTRLMTKRREKELKRLAVLETSRRHQEDQRKKEEAFEMERIGQDAKRRNKLMCCPGETISAPCCGFNWSS